MSMELTQQANGQDANEPGYVIPLGRRRAGGPRLRAQFVDADDAPLPRRSRSREHGSGCYPGHPTVYEVEVSLTAASPGIAGGCALSLRGVTRSLHLTAQVAVNGDIFRSYGEFSILQSSYGIPLVSVAGGNLKLKDELKFALDIVARKQE